MTYTQDPANAAAVELSGHGSRQRDDTAARPVLRPIFWQRLALSRLIRAAQLVSPPPASGTIPLSITGLSDNASVHDTSTSICTIPPQPDNNSVLAGFGRIREFSGRRGFRPGGECVAMANGGQVMAQYFGWNAGSSRAVGAGEYFKSAVR